MKMGWSEVEELLCVTEEGGVHIYDMFGVFKRQFTLGLVRFPIANLSVYGIHYFLNSLVVIQLLS